MDRLVRQTGVVRALFGVGLLLPYVQSAWAAQPICAGGAEQTAGWLPHKITVSKETTYVDGPLGKDGYVDFLAALNAYGRRRVTAENNAAAAILPILGPDVVPPQHRNSYFRELGIVCPPPAPRRFLSLTEFAQRKAQALNSPASAEKQGRNRADSASVVESGVPRRTDIPESTPERIPRRESGKSPVVIDTSKKLESQISLICDEPLKIADQPLLAEWIEANRVSLEEIAKGARRPRFWLPVVLEPSQPLFDALYPAYGLEATAEAARAFFARAMIAVSQGRTEDAWTDLMSGYRLTRLVSWGHSPFDVMRACGLEYAGAQGVVTLAHYGRLTAAQSTRYLAAFQRLPPRQSYAETYTTFRRFVLLDMLTRLAKSGRVLDDGASDSPVRDVAKPYQAMGAAGMIDFDEAMRLANQQYEQIAQAFAEPTRKTWRLLHEWEDGIQRDTKGLGQPLRDASSLILSPSPGKTAGRRLTLKLLWLTQGFLRAERNIEQAAEARTQMAQIALALAGYRADTGTYPEQLSLLCPKYLPQVPTDWYGSAPFHYRREATAFILYSAGPNGVDDDGNDTGDWSTYDIVVRPVRKGK